MSSGGTVSFREAEETHRRRVAGLTKAERIKVACSLSEVAARIGGRRVRSSRVVKDSAASSTAGHMASGITECTLKRVSHG